MSCLLALNDRAWPAVTILLVGIVTVLSLTPGAGTGPVSNDKLNHLIAYAAIAFPVALARPRHWPFFLCIVAGWSGVIEVIQPYVGRHASLADLFVNGLGILLGAVAGMLLRRLVSAPAPRRAPRESPVGRP